MSEKTNNLEDFDIDFELPDYSEQAAPAVTPQAAPTAPAVTPPVVQQPATAPAVPPTTTSGVAQKLSEAEKRLKELEARAAQEPDNPKMAFELMKATQEVASLRAAYETATIFERQVAMSTIPAAIDAAMSRNSHILSRLGERARTWLRSKLQQDITLVAQQDFSLVHNTGLIDTLLMTRYGEVMASAKPVPKGAAGVPNASAAPKAADEEELPEIAKAYGLSKEEWEAVKDFDLQNERFFKL